MKKLLFIVLMCLTTVTQAQTCHYCTEDELIEMLKGDLENYKIGYTDSGTKYLYVQKGFFMQVYYIYYNINTIYAIITESKDYANEVAFKLSKTYTKTSSISWEAENFNIKYNYENDFHAFVFTYK
jgi:hypothetical protein